MSDATDDSDRLRDLLDRVPETAAAVPPGLEELFAEVRGTLRVPFVGGLFRALSLDPALLRELWRLTGPALATEEAEREVARLTEHALFVAPSLDLGAQHRAWLHSRGLDEVRLRAIVAVNSSVQYAAARMMLAAAAFAAALEMDGAPGVAMPSAPRLKSRPLNIAPGAVRPEPIALDGHDPVLERRLESLRQSHGHPVVAGYYRALAAWPAYLERAEMDLRTVVGSLRYRACGELLATLAEVGVRGLVVPSPVRPGSGLTRAEALLLVRFFHRQLLPDLLIDATFLRALDDDSRKARALPF